MVYDQRGNLVNSNINSYPRKLDAHRSSNPAKPTATAVEAETHSLNMSHVSHPHKIETNSIKAMSEQLETNKLMDRQVGGWSIKGNLVNNGRCPKCTLKIPCKHYERVEDLPTVV